MSVKVKFIVGGREVSPDSFVDGLQSAMLKQVRDSVGQRLHRVKCSTHQSQPEVTVEVDGFKKMKFQIAACCQKLRNEAEDTLEIKRTLS